MLGVCRKKDAPMTRKTIALLLLLAAPALSANPYHASPGRIDLLYGGRGVGMAMLPGPAHELDEKVIDSFASDLHVDQGGALLAGKVCKELPGGMDVICNPVVARFD